MPDHRPCNPCQQFLPSNSHCFGNRRKCSVFCKPLCGPRLWGSSWSNESLDDCELGSPNPCSSREAWGYNDLCSEVFSCTLVTFHDTTIHLYSPGVFILLKQKFCSQHTYLSVYIGGAHMLTYESMNRATGQKSFNFHSLLFHNQ